MADSKPYRFNLAVSPDVHNRMQRLKSSTEAETLTDVIRRALAVYEALVIQVEDGGHIAFVDEDGTVRPLTLL